MSLAVNKVHVIRLLELLKLKNIEINHYNNNIISFFFKYIKIISV